jgi:DNA-binding transcriptional regulator YiaG
MGARRVDSKHVRAADLRGHSLARLRLKKSHMPTVDFCFEAALMQTDECVLWPYSVSGVGYGQCHYRGKATTAHRVVCTLAHGEPPTPQHTNVAHSCRNRHCVNPRHLRHATPAENQADRVRDGTDCRGETHGVSKLLSEQVVEIRRLRVEDKISIAELSQRYGIGESEISAIAHGRIWKHVGGPTCKSAHEHFTLDDVSKVLQMRRDENLSQRDLARVFGTTRSVIRTVLQGKVPKHLRAQETLRKKT